MDSQEYTDLHRILYEKKDEQKSDIDILSSKIASEIDATKNEWEIRTENVQRRLNPLKSINEEKVIKIDYEENLKNAENYMGKKEYQDAFNEFEIIIRSDPDNVDALAGKGLALGYLIKEGKIPGRKSFFDTFKGEEKDAINQTDQALVRDPSYVKAYYYKAKIYCEFNKKKKALIELDKGLSIENTNKQVLELKIQVLKDLHQYNECYTTIKHTISLYPDDYLLLVSISNTLIEMDYYDEAFIVAQKALDLTDVDLLKSLAAWNMMRAKMRDKDPVLTQYMNKSNM